MIDFTKMVTAEDKALQAREDTMSAIAARRWEAEVSGITVGGIPFETDRASQSLVTGAALAAMLDPAYEVQWKTPDGFVLIGGEQIIAVASAIRAHVQEAFNREAELIAAVEDGTFSPEMLQDGWPTAVDA